MDSIIAGVGIAVLLLLILLLVIAAFFLWIGAKLAGIQNATFGKAVVAALVSVIALAVLQVITSIIPFLGGLVGFLLGILVSIYIIKAVFDTSWGKALLAWILYVVAIIATVFIALVIGGIAIWSFL